MILRQLYNIINNKNLHSVHLEVFILTYKYHWVSRDSFLEKNINKNIFYKVADLSVIFYSYQNKSDRSVRQNKLKKNLLLCHRKRFCHLSIYLKKDKRKHLHIINTVDSRKIRRFKGQVKAKLNGKEQIINTSHISTSITGVWRFTVSYAPLYWS